MSEPIADFSASWDSYADQARRAGQAWPGDDWGDEALWDGWFDLLFRPHGVAGWERAVEIGPGTGKYTRRVLDAGCREVLGLDVSPRFLELCAERQRDLVEAGRLKLTRIAEDDPRALTAAVAAAGWTGRVDAVFSIDVLVHLTFTQITAYLQQAREVLRPGGWFVCSFADGTSERGFEKLVADVDRTLRARGNPTTGCFHWIAPELITSVAGRLGFAIVGCALDPLHGRDGLFVARLPAAEPAPASP